MSAYLTADLRQRLLAADDHRCACCQTAAAHFAWDTSGTRLIGLSAVGRATIIALNMNNEVIVDARRRWVSVGWHP
jgi:hypothetical protein